MAKEKILSGIDVGSSKIVTIIAQVSDEGQIFIVGVATVKSRGMKKGVVVDIDEAVEVISESLDAAERMAGFSVSSAIITVNGSQISSVNSSGVVAVSSSEGEINPQDVERATESARAISIPSSREIIHVTPRSFTVDSQEGVHDPVGMSGIRLQVETHIISGAATVMRNLVKCVNQVGVDVADLVFTGLASSEAVLTETEKELGVGLIDIGGGTTSLVLFVDGSASYSSVLPLGGKNITNDIAIGLRISLEDAEKIKLFLSGEKRPTFPEGKEPVPEEELDISELEIEGLNRVERKFLKDGIIKPRLEEIFLLVSGEIKKSGLEGLLPAGFVICGGAASTIGLTSVGKRILRVPIRIGTPTGVSGLIDEVSSTAYAASIGTIIYGAKIASTSRVLPFAGYLPKVGSYVKKGVEWIRGHLP